MRVLIDYRPALRDRTGVGEWVHSLVGAMAESASEGPDRDPEIDLTLFSSSWRDRLSGVPPGVHSVDRRIPVRTLNYCWHRLGWPPVEWIAGGGFDVVHSPHPMLMPTRGAARLVTIHDLDVLDNPDHADAEVRRDYPTLLRTHARAADHVVVPSQFTKAQVEQRLGIASADISICPNGAPAWAPRQSRPDPGHILFVGALTPRKNVGCLLEAYRLLLEGAAADPPPLVLAGPPTSHAAEWLSAIEAPPFKGHVRCTGYLERAALKALYDEAALLVLPSLHEGFGLPVVEAMTIGVPVVVSARGALPEVAGQAGLVVDALHPAGLARAIDRILTDDLLAQTCVERGFQQATRFSWRQSAVTLKAAYQHAYDRRRSMSP